MALNEEKTEAATPRRREELRQRGQVARSGEISAVAGLIAGVIALRLTASGIVSEFHQFTTAVLSRAGTVELNPGELQSSFISALLVSGRVLGPFLLATCIGGVVGGASQVGFILSAYPLRPNFQKLNLLQGLARTISVPAAVQLVKSLVKAIVIGYIVYTFLQAHLPSVVGLSEMSVGQMGALTGQLMWSLTLRTAAALAVIAGLDYVFQRLQFEKSNRMTKMEVKEEYKRSEGDPMIKGRRRHRQREIARQRMMQAVSQATVVITNPTHVAVALRYRPKEMTAPQLVAKGERLIAQRIKEIATENRIPIVENPPLARALNKSVKVGESIPAELYQAVAEVLAFVYRISGQYGLSDLERK